MGISRACASKWVNRWRRHRELGLLDRPSIPHHSPTATPAAVVAPIEAWRRENNWSAQRITHELADQGIRLNRRTVTRHLGHLGLNHRRFLDPNGDSNRHPGVITARWPGHMMHLDVKKVGQIPDGGGWRIHGRESQQKRAVDRAKTVGAGALHLPALGDRRSLPARLHRTAHRREGTNDRSLPRPSQGLVHLTPPRHPAASRPPSHRRWWHASRRGDASASGPPAASPSNCSTGARRSRCAPSAGSSSGSG